MSILTVSSSLEYLLALRDRPRNSKFTVTFNASQVQIEFGSEESSFLPILFLASRFPSTELRQAFELYVERNIWIWREAWEVIEVITAVVPCHIGQEWRYVKIVQQ